MKVVNMAIFYTDGKIQPVKFRINEEVVKIEKVLKINTESSVVYNKIVLVCQHSGCYI